MKIERVGKEVSYALRHNPMAYGLNLDDNGFCLIEDLLKAINEKNNYNRIIVKADLEEMMSKATKKRFEIVNDKIRALYGHSFNKLIIHEEVSVPDVLYHGTTHNVLSQILNEGLKPMSRQYVHLSKDIETATMVGKRRDEEPVILEINTLLMINDGIKFYNGNDDIYLTEFVLPKYLRVLKK